MKNIVIVVIDLIFVRTRDVKRALIERFKDVVNTFFFKKINEKNVEEFFNVEKNNLFYNVVIQQFRRRDARKTCNSEQQMKLLFKFLMNKFRKF